MKILLVDDMSDTRMLLALHLKRMGYPDTHQASSALEALHILGETDSAPGSNFDLILMDLYMPGMSGLEACTRIKENERLADIPLIMITAESSPEELGKAFEAGATDYITKPLVLPILKARVQSALRLKQEMDRRKAREAELLALQLKLEDANRGLLELATCDGLTGICNRRAFDERLKLEWTRALRTGQALALLMIDVDYFKAYNDCYGHVLGDACLQQVARGVNSAVRRRTDLVARYGGEEFVVMLPETCLEASAGVGERIRAAVAETGLPHTGSSLGRVTVSVGVANLDRANLEQPQELIARADRALYKAKREGRNRVAVAEKAHDE